MRHPAAPTVVAFLLGLLAFLVLWGKVSGGGHHEGNPHPDDVPVRLGGEKGEEEEEQEEEEGGREEEGRKEGGRGGGR